MIIQTCILAIHHEYLSSLLNIQQRLYLAQFDNDGRDKVVLILT